MRDSLIVVQATWDDEVGVWVATSTDIDGLVVEAPTIDILEGRVLAVLDDLIELNGLPTSS